MDDLDEFLEASGGDGEYFAGSTEQCFEQLFRVLNPNTLPNWERFKRRGPNECWDAEFVSDYNGYQREWLLLRMDIKANGGNFGPHERYKLTRLAQQLESIGSYWAT